MEIHVTACAANLHRLLPSGFLKYDRCEHGTGANRLQLVVNVLNVGGYTGASAHNMADDLLRALEQYCST